MINNLRRINPHFSWRNHFLMLPCDHGPSDCMFSRDFVTNKTRDVHPWSREERLLRYMMVSGDQHRAHFRPGHDLRIPVPMYEIMPRPVLQLEVPPPRRELLFFWGGASRHRGANIRRDLWKYQSNTTGFYVPISTFGEGRNVPPNNPQTASVSFDYWMPRSVFCGSPPGWDGGDSNRYLPALVHGCTSLLRGLGAALVWGLMSSDGR